VSTERSDAEGPAGEKLNQGKFEGSLVLSLAYAGEAAGLQLELDEKSAVDEVAKN